MAIDLSGPFVRRPVATTLIAVGIMLLGLLAFRMLPVASLPQVEFPTIAVTANLPGADPDTVASSLATPLERQFSAIAGITDMTSVSYSGSVRIVIQFDRTRRAGRHQRRDEPPAQRHGRRADLSQGQPRRSANHGAGADLADR